MDQTNEALKRLGLSSLLGDQTKSGEGVASGSQTLTDAERTAKEQKKAEDSREYKAAGGYRLLDAEKVELVVTGPTSLPCLAWRDEYISECRGAGFKKLEDADIITLGEIFLQSVFLGPVRHAATICTALAMNLISPENKKLRLLNQKHCGNVVAAPNSDLDSISSAVTIGTIQGDLKRVIDAAGAQQGTIRPTSMVAPQLAMFEQSSQVMVDVVKYQHTLATVKEYISIISGWDPDVARCFYTFFAAVCARVITKQPSTVAKHLQDVPSKLATFYRVETTNLILPNIPTATLDAVAIGLAPCREYSKALVSTYATASIEAEEDQQIKGLLNYTLLLHTSFNGMQMVPLAIAAAAEMGTKDLLKLMRDFASDGTKESIGMLIDYFAMYQLEPKANGEYAAWCRIFNEKYWSWLSAKHHQVLATLLMATLEEKNSGIWGMQAYKGDERLKNTARLIISQYKAQQTGRDMFSGVREGSLLHRAGQALIKSGELSADFVLTEKPAKQPTPTSAAIATNIPLRGQQKETIRAEYAGINL